MNVLNDPRNGDSPLFIMSASRPTEVAKKISGNCWNGGWMPFLTPSKQTKHLKCIHRLLTYDRILSSLTAAEWPHLCTLCVHLRNVGNSLAQHFNRHVSSVLVFPVGCLVTCSTNLIPTVGCTYMYKPLKNLFHQQRSPQTYQMQELHTIRFIIKLITKIWRIVINQTLDLLPKSE